MLIMSCIKIAIFASGSGTNAENIIKYFRNNSLCEVSLLLCNKKDAYVIERAKQFNVSSIIFTKSQFEESSFIDDLLSEKGIEYIILAGFLLKIPERLLNKYPKKIINIHPALLPKYGGKGMHGMHVHEAVIAAGEKESGITVHIIDADYDKGETIFQAKCTIEKEDTPEMLASKIHELEQRYFPEAIENYILKTR
ncbi:Phosphoribosylglycinamide formyltransferase [bioreactor metagenome]|uniref:phosphoribosylglycinamide formyltransferase 1 n=1 Tax=bioreactor metagenome TaxID=1076179 RepID=A0A645DZ03_9ZZZZ